MAIEESQQQSSDMRTVNIGIGHNYNFMIATFIGIKIITSDTGAQSGNNRADFSRIKHFIKTGAFNVQNFTAQRHNRLIFTIASLLSRTTRGISFHDEHF